MTYYAQQLKEQGYFVIEKVISEDICKELLGYVISSFSGSQPDFIAWLLDTIRLVSQCPGEFTLSEIGSQLGVEVLWLIEFFSYYGSEGWFCTN